MREAMIARARVSLALVFLRRVKVFSFCLLFFAMFTVICILTDSLCVQFPRQHDSVKVNVFCINNFFSFYRYITEHV